MSREFVGVDNRLFIPGVMLEAIFVYLLIDERPYQFARETYQGPVGDFLRYLQENGIEEVAVTLSIAIVGALLLVASQNYIETDPDMDSEYHTDDVHY